MANLALERLRRQELSLGVVLRQARSVETGKIFQTAGFDWLFLDLEHNSMSIETACEISVACLGTGIAPLVRVPENQYWMATRALDGGAQGIVLPHVDTEEQARETVRQLRYPPAGRRSISSMQVHVDFRSVPVGELTAQLDKDFLIAVMLETITAIENSEAIAAVDGIDVVMIGANDLCLDMGIAGDVMNERVIKAFERVAAACRKHGRYAGLGGVRRPEDLKVYFDMGYRFILAANDVTMLVDAGQRRTASLRSLI
ncbi:MULTISPECIES: HpcH/HpaI aldolase family protein [Chelativorans]|jgi:2-keto-3-deoxy-L-rhamnonate aldolase RhmA|uniref:HpcH/HpaI aldolase n=1 Tax=Chelativorans sp. (strain BNC1) TaxID=266779 RepID=Q11JH1_CHESB|nr:MULTISPECIES: aldolase/citrate lyase family protein [Chelativorans]